MQSPPLALLTAIIACVHVNSIPMSCQYKHPRFVKYTIQGTDPTDKKPCSTTTKKIKPPKTRKEERMQKNKTLKQTKQRIQEGKEKEKGKILKQSTIKNQRRIKEAPLPD